MQIDDTDGAEARATEPRAPFHSRAHREIRNDRLTEREPAAITCPTQALDTAVLTACGVDLLDGAIDVHLPDARACLLRNLSVPIKIQIIGVDNGPVVRCNRRLTHPRDVRGEKPRCLSRGGEQPQPLRIGGIVPDQIGEVVVAQPHTYRRGDPRSLRRVHLHTA